ncbi:ras-related protein Rab-28-like isoform X2 [Anthonomus grandis grandis]|uniref:ras-related protein Rab-28-like isoform X2 n=1 Tax=Anthonomus grandis grandis TaxID=2921223 RepID=UPI002166AD9D|nr:ras-related protein Rab-28-like isoform X2 [Anthonomus grandis grandis]
MSDSEEEANEKQLKVVLMGEQMVGKTNLIKKFCFEEFSRIYVPTIGADFYVKRLSFLGNKEVTVRLTDVSGLELNGHMMATYLFQVNIIILVYDITSHPSFDSLENWLSKIKSISPEEMVITTFGNKCDIEHKRAVRLDRTNHFVHENKLSNYFVSAKTGENVGKFFIYRNNSKISRYAVK